MKHQINILTMNRKSSLTKRRRKNWEEERKKNLSGHLNLETTTLFHH